MPERAHGKLGVASRPARHGTPCQDLPYCSPVPSVTIYTESSSVSRQMVITAEYSDWVS